MSAYGLGRQLHLQHNAGMLDYQQLIDLGLSPDLNTLTARAVDAAEALGFGLCSGALIQGRFGINATVQSFGNPPAGFLESSKSLDEGLRDPLLSRLLASPGQARYDQSLYVQAGSADLWDCQAPYGYRNGLSCAMHHPNVAEVFFFGIDTPDALPTSAGSLLELQAQLQLITLHAQSALIRLVARPGPIELEKGEIDALQIAGATIYAKRGRFTVIERLKDPKVASAAKKLDARTTTAAVLRAIEGGLIQR